LSIDASPTTPSSPFHIDLRRWWPAVLGLAVFAGLIWAPGTLAGHAVNYSGTYAQADHGGPAPELDFTVGMGKRNGRLVPRFLRAFRTRGLGMKCPSGHFMYATDGGQNGFAHYAGDIAVAKNRTLSGHIPEDDISGAAWWVTGKIPKSGPASGTVRMSIHVPEEGGLCDSGVVSWTAAKG
jgi:hypothetical protein